MFSGSSTCHGSSSKSVSGMFIVVTVTSRSQTRFTGIMCVYVLLFALYCLTCCISIHGQLEPVCLSMSPLQFLYRAIISVLQILFVLLGMYAICRCERLGVRSPADLGDIRRVPLLDWMRQTGARSRRHVSCMLACLLVYVARVPISSSSSLDPWINHMLTVQAPTHLSLA